MEQAVDIVKSIPPLIGVLVGWGFSQWSEKLKTAREDRRRLRKTLYYLLELHHQVRIFEANDESVKTFISILKKKFPVITENDSTLINKVIIEFTTFFRKQMPETLKAELATLKANYLKSVEALAEVDPILAYRLNGRQSIDDTIDGLLKHARESVGNFAGTPMTPKDQVDMENAFKFFEPKVLKENLLLLEEVMLDVAAQIDKKTLKRTKKRIEPVKTGGNLKEIEELIDRFFEGAPIPPVTP